ncbi:hypothetical protein BDW69DRAFT_178557 [Aspergillus filifer]
MQVDTNSSILSSFSFSSFGSKKGGEYDFNLFPEFDIARNNRVNYASCTSVFGCLSVLFIAFLIPHSLYMRLPGVNRAEYQRPSNKLS